MLMRGPWNMIDVEGPTCMGRKCDDARVVGGRRRATLWAFRLSVALC